MRPKTLLVLVLLVAVLGGFIFFYEKELPSTDERRELAKKVLRIEEDAVRAVTIEHDGRTVRLERVDAGADEATTDPEWRLTEPLEARADRAAVEGLLGTLAGLEHTRELEDVDRADAGLEKPGWRVTVVTAGGETELTVGAELPAGGGRVVAVGGAVYQVAGQAAGGFVDELSREPGDWRDKKLFHAPRTGVERVTLAPGEALGGDRILLGRRGDAFWLESPIADRADASRVDRLLTELTGLRAATFVDGDAGAAELGLEPPAAVVEAVLEGREEPFRLALGAPTAEGAKRRYARAGGQLVELDTGLAELLGTPAAAWRSRAWTAVQAFQVEAAEVTGTAGAFELTRDDGEWRRDGERIDYAAASDLLYAVADAEAEEVLTREEAEARGLRLGEDPLLTVHLDAGDREAELTLHPRVDGRAAATSEGREAVLLLGAETVDAIVGAASAVRDAEPLPAAENGENEDEAGEAGPVE